MIWNKNRYPNMLTCDSNIYVVALVPFCWTSYKKNMHLFQVIIFFPIRQQFLRVVRFVLTGNKYVNNHDNFGIMIKYACYSI